MNTGDALHQAINTSDHAELLRWIDRFDTAGSFDALIDLVIACNGAVERGHQLGGVAAHAAYRIALHGPLDAFVEVMDETDDRFTPGPFAEVLAYTHPYQTLSEELPLGALRLSALAESALRTPHEIAAVAMDEMYELPTTLLSWEPEYALAEYYDTEGIFPPYSPTGTLPALQVPQRSQEQATRRTPDQVSYALSDVVAHWSSGSTGRTEHLTIHGTAIGALGELGIRRGQLQPISLADAMGLMAWAGASGAANGRRRGAAAGRFAAWSVLAELAGVEWPPDPALLEAQLHGIGWYTFDAGAPVLGWQFRFAIEDPANGIAWVISADDMS